MSAPKASIDIVSAEFRAWEVGMKASSQQDDGEALSLKTKFVNLGSHNREIEDYKKTNLGEDQM